jgi:hypothetical protein
LLVSDSSFFEEPHCRLAGLGTLREVVAQQNVPEFLG